jgi:hypothetical protein
MSGCEKFRGAKEWAETQYARERFWGAGRIWVGVRLQVEGRNGLREEAFDFGYILV